MSPVTRAEQHLDRALARATTPRGATIVIAIAMISIAVVSGVLMTVIDGENYPTVGSGLGWAVQTTTTVGYGDHVPTTAGGRLLAAFVMLIGIGFLTVITAAITSAFVAGARLDQAERGEAPTAEQIHDIDKRLERIEAALTNTS